MGVVTQKASEDDSAVWRVKAEVGSEEIEFRLDTGADVTVIPARLYTRRMGKLESTKIKLYSANAGEMELKGKLITKLKVQNGLTTDLEAYVVHGLKHALLGRPAIKRMKLLTVNEEMNIYGVQKDVLVDPTLFEGLGLMEEDSYTIKLKEDAQPFAIRAPRRVPLPLMPKLKEELQRLKDSQVISPVQEPTDWCAGIVVSPNLMAKLGFVWT